MPGRSRPRPWAAAIIAATTSTRTSTPTPWNTRFPTKPSSSWTDAASRAARRSTTASRTAPRARRSSPAAATAAGLPPRSRAWGRRGQTCSGNPKSRGDEENPYQNEWNDLVDAIRNDKPYNEVKRGVEASLVTSMGRMAAHTGKIITYDQMLNGQHEFAPGLDKLTMDSPAPLRGRRRRQVSGAATGHRHRPRVCPDPLSRRERVRAVVGCVKRTEGNGGLRTESNPCKRLSLFWTGSRNAP